MQKLIQQFFILVLICMLGLAFIVANSLITNNLEEKTYENAMLRTLGWNQRNIVLITLIKSTLFFIIPGFIVAILVLFGFTTLTKSIIETLLKRQIILDFTFLPVIVGLFVAYALPIISMI
jgi:ABC-type antimicrobial peptide transport system permease subunit